jgi:hypothetical protein
MRGQEEIQIAGESAGSDSRIQRIILSGSFSVHPEIYRQLSDNNKHRWLIQLHQIRSYGNQDSYINKIVSAGFDGVYLDIIDAFEYFEWFCT